MGRRGVGEDAKHADDIDLALAYAAWAAHTAEGKALHIRRAVQGAAQARLHELVPVERETRDGVDRLALSESHLRRREGFALTDAGTDLVGALDQAHYCIWCHEQQKDSCSSGLHEKKPADGSAPAFKKSPFGVTLAGCPLEEKISEFHKLRTKDGRSARWQ